VKTTQDYLDQLATAKGIKSDYAIAKKLGISKQAVSNYRNRKASFDAYIAAKVAEELQIPEIEVIAAASAERAAKKKRSAEAKYWENLWNRVRSGTQALAVILAVVFAWQPIDASAKIAVEKTDVLYITRILGCSFAAGRPWLLRTLRFA
jgi:transcriptional regulator with XRE-family HTH domain